MSGVAEKPSFMLYSLYFYLPETHIEPCLNVSNIESIRQELVQGGYQPWNPEEIPGRPRFFCRDPFNNIVEFTQIVEDYTKY